MARQTVRFRSHPTQRSASARPAQDQLNAAVGNESTKLPEGQFDKAATLDHSGGQRWRICGHEWGVGLAACIQPKSALTPQRSSGPSYCRRAEGRMPDEADARCFEVAKDGRLGEIRQKAASSVVARIDADTETAVAGS